jgi:hypothetical protein
LDSDLEYAGWFLMKKIIPWAGSNDCFVSGNSLEPDCL